jgi:hypothetical protein
MGFEPTTFCMAISSVVCGELRLLSAWPANRAVSRQMTACDLRLFLDFLLPPCCPGVASRA